VSHCPQCPGVLAAENNCLAGGEQGPS